VRAATVLSSGVPSADAAPTLLVDAVEEVFELRDLLSSDQDESTPNSLNGSFETFSAVPINCNLPILHLFQSLSFGNSPSGSQWHINRPLSPHRFLPAHL
jgi:hypothetical protein